MWLVHQEQELGVDAPDVSQEQQQQDRGQQSGGKPAAAVERDGGGLEQIGAATHLGADLGFGNW